MPTSVIALVASLCLLVALVQSWIIVAHFSAPEGPVARAIPGGRDLVRSHIDYLMMAQFLFVFYGLFRLFALTPSVWLVALMSFGSFFNPFAFFWRALKPEYVKTPGGFYKLVITVSCIATTIGYGWTAIILAKAALAAAA